MTKSLALVAGPAFMQGKTIATPDDLTHVPVLGALEVDRILHLRMLDRHGRKRNLVLEARLGVEHFVVRKQAALAGVGFTVLPMMHCEAELNNGSLVRLLPEWSMPGGWLQAVYPHQHGVLPAVRAWIDPMECTFKGCPEGFI